MCVRIHQKAYVKSRVNSDDANICIIILFFSFLLWNSLQDPVCCSSTEIAVLEWSCGCFYAQGWRWHRHMDMHVPLVFLHLAFLFDYFIHLKGNHVCVTSNYRLKRRKRCQGTYFKLRFLPFHIWNTILNWKDYLVCML